jgi:uncharacterized repeat protein (TIGR04138 family)
MQNVSFDEVLDRILIRDPRYHRDAYHFLREALDFTKEKIVRAPKDEERHITGQELLQGIRAYALEEFGPMTLTVLEEWGVRRCEDFGELVFNLIEHGVLKKTRKDSREDFRGGYDFVEAFKKPFLPASVQVPEPNAVV